MRRARQSGVGLGGQASGSGQNHNHQKQDRTPHNSSVFFNLPHPGKDANQKRSVAWQRGKKYSVVKGSRPDRNSRLKSAGLWAERDQLRRAHFQDEARGRNLQPEVER